MARVRVWFRVRFMVRFNARVMVSFRIKFWGRARLLL